LLSRAIPLAKTRVKLRARDAECVGDRLHSEPSSGNDGKHEMSRWVIFGPLDSWDDGFFGQEEAMKKA
jgi:hypothetical protein